ncbi:MAG: TetR/AcrR family transcriptional regulator [Parvibaculum sp.]|nr:TetR/AcrR family transcriptional regulator [Parvibaculum sp.]|tara:strand:+ start:546 stop:1196 length:651 start_codon:yes stop_codon:yes gene_type:complete
MATGSFDLAIKRAPRQKRAVETYERILQVSTRLLTDLGVDGITTNLIAAEAGIKVPTLYRYFPNKYAVLMALGNRLMAAQNIIIEQWLSRSEENRSPGALIDDIEFLIAGTIKVTRAEPGALAISLALRAVPALQNVRLTSHRMMTDLITARISDRLTGVPRDLLWPRIRLSLDLAYAAIEMALEEPMVDDEMVSTETTRQIRAYWTVQLELWLKE